MKMIILCLLRKIVLRQRRKWKKLTMLQSKYSKHTKDYVCYLAKHCVG
jgi:hypothetical protein